ncbi:TPA: hypothetical protein ACV73Y_004445 [Escherichia coli]
MQTKSFFDNDKVAIKSEGKKRCRQFVKKARLQASFCFIVVTKNKEPLR